MKINIYGARSIPARWSGFDNTATELAEQFVKDGHEVHAYIMPKYGLPERPSLWKGVKLHYLPTIYGKHLETPIHETLSTIVAIFHPADIHYVLGCRNSWVWIIHRLFGRKVVFNTDGLDFKRSKWGRMVQAYLRFNYRVAAMIGTALIQDNTHIKQYFIETYGKEGAFISIGGHSYNSSDESVIKQYNVSSGEYYLIACRLEPDNNILELVQGFVQSNSTKKLLVAGGANYKSTYVEEVEKIKDLRVVFLGPVYTDNHIEELHYHCFAYIHGHEVGGTNPSLLKAMGMKNLILANGTNYNREVLGEENGVFFDATPGDVAMAVNEADLNSETLRHRGEKACERMKKYYTWPYSAQLHEEYFEYLLGQRQDFRETF